jgi:hypothetical protein
MGLFAEAMRDQPVSDEQMRIGAAFAKHILLCFPVLARQVYEQFPSSLAAALSRLPEIHFSKLRSSIWMHWQEVMRDVHVFLNVMLANAAYEASLAPKLYANSFAMSLLTDLFDDCPEAQLELLERVLRDIMLLHIGGIRAVGYRMSILRNSFLSRPQKAVLKRLRLR